MRELFAGNHGDLGPGGGLGGERVFGVGRDARKFHGTLYICYGYSFVGPEGLKNPGFTGPLILAEVSWDPTSAVCESLVAPLRYEEQKFHGTLFTAEVSWDPTSAVATLILAEVSWDPTSPVC